MLSATLVDAATMVDFGDLDQDSTFESRVFFEHSGFRAAVSLGSVVEGHTLLCPSEWDVQRSGAYSIFDTIQFCGSLDEFVKALDSLREVLKTEFGTDTMFFEHGGYAASSSQRCGTCFPHLHVIPYRSSTNQQGSSFLDLLLREVYGEYDVRTRYCDLREFLAGRRRDGEYLLSGDDNGVAALWAGTQERFRSQVMRHVFQRLLGVTPNNWQRTPDVDGAIAVADRLRSAVETQQSA